MRDISSFFHFLIVTFFSQFISLICNKSKKSRISCFIRNSSHCFIIFSLSSLVRYFSRSLASSISKCCCLYFSHRFGWHTVWVSVQQNREKECRKAKFLRANPVKFVARSYGDNFFFKVYRMYNTVLSFVI